MIAETKGPTHKGRVLSILWNTVGATCLGIALSTVVGRSITHFVGSASGVILNAQLALWLLIALLAAMRNPVLTWSAVVITGFLCVGMYFLHPNAIDLALVLPLYVGAVIAAELSLRSIGRMWRMVDWTGFPYGQSWAPCKMRITSTTLS